MARDIRTCWPREYLGMTYNDWLITLALVLGRAKLALDIIAA